MRSPAHSRGGNCASPPTLPPWRCQPDFRLPGRYACAPQSPFSLSPPVQAPAAPCSARCQQGVFIRQNLTAWDFQRAPERVVFVLPGSRDLRVRLSKQTFSIQSNNILCLFGKSVFISSSEGLRTSKVATSMPFLESLSWVWLKCQVK